MRSVESAEERRLTATLEHALAQEKRLWKRLTFRHGQIQGTDIHSRQYQDVVLWLGDLSRFFKFCPETNALGVCILSRLLASVKAQFKYLKCIAITSLVLAEKINEDDEVMVPIKELVVKSGCHFSTAEILRMERIILEKLHWDLYMATPVDFIHIFHGLALAGRPDLPSPDSQKKPCFQTSPWIMQVQHCMACHQLSQFKGSTLALAIITLELERLIPDWFSVLTDLLKRAQVSSRELIHCKEIVDECLASLDLPFPSNALYIFDSASIASTHAGFHKGAWKAKAMSEQSRRDEEGDVDDFYDGFRCLYSDGAMADRQEDCPICPPLQPPGT